MSDDTTRSYNCPLAYSNAFQYRTTKPNPDVIFDCDRTMYYFLWNLMRSEFQQFPVPIVAFLSRETM